MKSAEKFLRTPKLVDVSKYHYIIKKLKLKGSNTWKRAMLVFWNISDGAKTFDSRESARD